MFIFLINRYGNSVLSQRDLIGYVWSVLVMQILQSILWFLLFPQL